MGRTRAIVFALTLAGTAIGPIFPARDAWAQKEDAEAKRLFEQGSKDFLGKRYDSALVSLQKSYDLFPSPSSGLLIARCLRELDRPIESVKMYDTVIAMAKKDSKYAQTADVATGEQTAVKAKLGTVHVRITKASPGARLLVDGVTTPLENNEAEVLHASGEVSVRFEPASGSPQTQRASLAQGGQVTMEFTPGDTRPAIAPPPPKKEVEPEPPGWTAPAAIVTGGLTLAGAGVFVGFGLQSNSIYDELNSKCGGVGCGDTSRARADEGKRDQTIANVGLVVGVTAAVATVAILLYRAYGPRSSSTSAHFQGVLTF